MQILDSVRLPVDIERGVQGGPEFRTTLRETDGGGETANVTWAYPKMSWQAAYGITTLANLEAAIATFWVCHGRAYGFLFKDWADYKIEDGEIGLGDTSEVAFQIVKLYEAGTEQFVRPITRPIESTLIVYLDGVELLSSDWTLGALGVLTLDSAPGAGVIVSVDCEFDIPVRFDTDKLEILLEWELVGSIPSFPIREIREVSA